MNIFNTQSIMLKERFVFCHHSLCKRKILLSKSLKSFTSEVIFEKKKKKPAPTDKIPLVECKLFYRWRDSIPGNGATQSSTLYSTLQYLLFTFNGRITSISEPPARPFLSSCKQNLKQICIISLTWVMYR